MTIRLLVGFAFVLFLAGCAGVTVKPYKKECNKHPRGIVYNQSATYLFVYTDNEGRITSELKQLPDPSRLMTAKPFAVLSNSNTVLNFSADGLLTEGTNEIDTTKIPKAVINALGKAALTSVAGARDGENTSGTIPGPLVFKLMVADGVISLVGQDNPTSNVKVN